VLDNALSRREGLEESAIFSHALDLGAELIEGLVARGFSVITPKATGERAGNVCFVAEDAAGLAERLAQRGGLLWGSADRVPVSAHLYNDHDDVRALFKALDEVR